MEEEKENKRRKRNELLNRQLDEYIAHKQDTLA
jgi:hypothetical protein